MEIQLLTSQEKHQLQEQLKAMIAKRPQIATRIAEAREKGDLRENADYHAAREELAMLEARISDLQERLKSASVVNPDDIPADMVFLGSVVRVRDTASGEVETFRLAGEVNSGGLDQDGDILAVSAKSPLGQALMRARLGQTVRVNVPRGEIHYEILEIH
ncbi:MAG: transcription elongation factor GreA [Planctomycetes bacterium]|jgi:transcription elongation factor GreA|nr:transcription elongation factor GreA [Planctomycetota bacterium]